MKKIIITTTFVLLYLFSFSQDLKDPIAFISTFEEASGNVEAGDISNLQNIVLEGLIESKRFNVVNSEEAANYLITGEILEFKTGESETEVDPEAEPEAGNSNGKVSIRLNLKVIDKETGSIIATEILNSSSQTGIDKVFKSLQQRVRVFMVTKFPFTAPITEISKQKKSSASEVLILVGADSGLKKNTKLEVMQYTTSVVNGKTYHRKQSIGELKITKMEGDFAVCDVKKGGKDISELMQKGKSLRCQLLK